MIPVQPVSQDSQMVIEVKDLAVHFFVFQGRVPAVNGVSLSIERGKTLGVVGESGCGKSVTGLAIMHLLPTPPAKVVNGEIIFHRHSTGEVIDITKLSPQSAEMRNIRGNDIAMIFQEPMTSLTPAYTIGEQIMEAIILHQKVDKREARQRAVQMLDRVGMPQPGRNVDSYPHQLSGGMLQRAMIAAALSCQPSLLIADEPTTALDVTTAAQILDLMGQLQDEMGMAIMHVSHNLGVVAEVADEVAVMYLGRIVERSSVDDLFYNPKHPYTRGLMHSIPQIGQRQRLEPIRGVVPEPDAIPKGCAFAPRCPLFSPTTCPPIDPPIVTVGPGHEVLCYRYNA
jgi:peptide/nickel transport system ATP-binding protein